MSKPVELPTSSRTTTRAASRQPQAMVKLTGGTGKYLVLQLYPGPARHRRTGEGLRGRDGHGRGEGPPVRLPGHRPAMAAERSRPRSTPTRTSRASTPPMSPPRLGAARRSRRPASRARSSSSRSTAAPNQVTDLKEGVYDALIAQAAVRHGLQLGQAGRRGDPRRGRSRRRSSTTHRPSCSRSPRRTPTAPRRSRGSTRPTSTPARRSRSAADPDPRPTTMPRHQRRGIVIPWRTPQPGEGAERMRR